MHDLSPAELARLADYLVQELPIAEVPLVEQWIAEDPTRQTFVRQLMLGRGRGIRQTSVATVRDKPGIDAFVYALMVEVERDKATGGANSRVVPRTVPPVNSPVNLHVNLDAELHRDPYMNAHANPRLDLRPSSCLDSRTHLHTASAADSRPHLYATPPQKTRTVVSLTHTTHWFGNIDMHAIPRRMWYAFVGVVTVVTAFVLATLQISNSTHRPTPAMTSYVTGNGQRASITLPDGTAVVLGVASRLEVPSNYTNGNRTVHLSGEAVFTVPHHERHPFAVTTSTTITHVLGTSFFVRQYPADTSTMVSVRNGKVAIHPMDRTVAQAMGHSTVLSASQQAEIGRSGLPRVMRADLSQFSFATGILTLNSVPLPQAIIELGRWYDADIRLGDPTLATRWVTGECAAGSLADLVDILELTLDVRVVRHGRVLTLFPR